MFELRYFVDAGGRAPFEGWFTTLDPTARAKVAVALSRLEQGNVSNVKSVEGGVQELRIDFGPGYRVYFGRDGSVLVILLTGGTKKRQQHDIETAGSMWNAYRHARR